MFVYFFVDSCVEDLSIISIAYGIRVIIRVSEVKAVTLKKYKH